MKYTRRDIVISSISTLAVMATAGQTWSEESNVDEISKLYGMPDLRKSSPDLEFLRRSQENRPAVPIKMDDYVAYVEKLPLMQRIRSGEAPDLYHLLQWNALALDLTSQDHTTIANVPDSTYAEQFGPHSSSCQFSLRRN